MGTDKPQEHAPSPQAIDGARVLVTGASGFVGRHVVRELLAQGYEPLCLVRSRNKLLGLIPAEHHYRIGTIEGDVLDPAAVARAAEGCRAAIHLVGIIEEHRLRGVTFRRMHVEATQVVLDACRKAGVRRYVHMSALGARENAASTYHQTKWDAEQRVRESGLDWTIFRPSIIHGPDGEFMKMMKFFSTSSRQPVMPYFGSGERQVQPVSVLDVALVFVEALRRPESIGQMFELGGPERLTWKELYDVCATAIAGHTRPKVPVPVSLAKLMAVTLMPLMPAFVMPYSFNLDQVQMSQEDSICDPTPAQTAFGIRFRGFRKELISYADRIGES